MDTIRDMKPEAIKRLRQAIGETQSVFAKRFARSVRSVENWEQGVCCPDAFVLRELLRLAGEHNARNNGKGGTRRRGGVR